MALDTAYATRKKDFSTTGQVNFTRPDEVVKFVEKHYKNPGPHRMQMERQWFLNICQYLGLQYHTFDQASSMLTLPQAPPWRVRLVCNRLQQIVQKRTAKMLRQRPIWNVIPASNDTDDQSRAIVGNRVAKSYWRHLQMDTLLVKAFTWLGTTGNVFLSPHWDSEKEAELGFDESEMPKDALMGPAGALPRQVHLGDAVVDLCTPYEMGFDSMATCIEESPWARRSKTLDIEYLVDRYGSKAKEIMPARHDSNSLTRQYERRLQGLGGPLYAGSSKSQEEEAHEIVCHTFWLNPCRRYPDGVYAVVAGGMALEIRQALPRPFRQKPFVHLQEIPVPGRLWGTCGLEQCLPLQARYNRGRSQITENANLMARPKILSPKGSTTMQGSFTSEPGEVIEYTPGLKPEPWTPPPIPEYVFKLLEYDLKDMEDISAVHEVTQARAPSGVRTGVAIAQLQEMDDQTLAPTFLTVEKALSQVGSWLLQIVAENVTEERLVKVVGKSNEVDAQVFKGSDLLGHTAGANYFDVETQMGSQLPTTAMAKRDFIMGLVQSGVLNPVEDRKKILHLLDLGTEEPLIVADNLDRQNARRENWQMAQGVMVEPNAFDEPGIHWEEHMLFQKGAEYAKIIGVNHMVRQAFEYHMAMTHAQMQPLLSAAGPVPTQPTLEGPPTPPMEAPQPPAPPADYPMPEEMPREESMMQPLEQE